MIKINIISQTLEHYQKGMLTKQYSISSAKNGTGEVEGSFCTPTGQFKIAEKIGKDLALGSVLVGRKPTGEIYSAQLSKEHPNRDWILTRILWLDGMDAHNKNTKNRYIYIHGSPDKTNLGVPGSKGCIQMKNQEMIELFDIVQTGEDVAII